MKRPFQFKIPKPRHDEGRLNRPEPITLVEGFVGEIQGKASSDLEERFARALDKRKLEYEFRVAAVVGRNLPGEVELDFLVSEEYPVQVDGEMAHKTAEQRSKDRANDAILDDALQGAAFPVVRVPGDRLQTQEDADAKVKELFNV